MTVKQMQHVQRCRTADFETQTDREQQSSTARAAHHPGTTRHVPQASAGSPKQMNRQLRQMNSCTRALCTTLNDRSLTAGAMSLPWPSHSLPAAQLAAMLAAAARRSR